MSRLRAQFSRELRAAGLPSGPGPVSPVAESDVATLPRAVQRYLRFMGVVGRPRDWSFRAGWKGRFRLAPGKRWMALEAWQYDTRLELARLFYMRLRFFGLLPVLGRDTYRDGRGRMLVRPLDLFTVQDGSGPEFDSGELVTYLNDCILVAPALLLGPEARWIAVDDESFDVALSDRFHTVRARVLVDEHGAPRDFTTTDRFSQDPRDTKRFVRTRWSTPVAGWQMVGGRPLATSGKAVWHVPAGDFAYAEMSFIDGSVAFNVAPGD
ncbi:MAG TPA: DUF6544 family protein [Myxococcaceae bacterium]|nr:DUF6544 family protein [Myxococcaceae bacterium]